MSRVQLPAFAELSTAIEDQIDSFAKAVKALCTIPDVQRRTAELIIAETGGGMSAFPSAKHLASWARICPRNDESAGKRRSGKTHKGSKWLRASLTEAAKAASRTKDTYLHAQYQRLRACRGHDRRDALDARRGLADPPDRGLYVDPGGDYLACRDPERTTKRLVAQLE